MGRIMNQFDWKKFLSVEVLIFALGSLGAGFLAYGDLKAQDAAFAQKLVSQEQLQQQQYQSLKEGQKELRELMQQMLRDQANRNQRDD